MNGVQGVEDQDDIKKRLVLGGDHHLPGWNGTTHFAVDANHPARAPDRVAGINLAGPQCAFLCDQRVGKKQDAQDRHKGIDLDQEK